VNVIDHGKDDPLPFELGNWQAVADKTREHIEAVTGRELTDIEVRE
jgi:hypothetical protein